MRFEGSEGIVVASDGADQLGGKDWDELIMDYLYSEFRKRTGKSIPDDMGWEIQQKALQAKFDLTEDDEATIIISDDGRDVEISLLRKDEAESEYGDFDMDADRPFYFEERSSNLMSLCRTICLRVMEKAAMTWGDVDDIVMAGGSCRMPMIHKMLEEMSGRKINKNIPGFSYDTAISIGAAVHASRQTIIKDVISKTIGIEIINEEGQPEITHLIHKNQPLPAFVEEEFTAVNNAILKVYEGEAEKPNLCVLRGQLNLANPAGKVKVMMRVNEEGILESVVELGSGLRKELKIRTEDEDVNLLELKNKLHSIDVRI